MFWGRGSGNSLVRKVGKVSGLIETLYVVIPVFAAGFGGRAGNKVRDEMQIGGITEATLMASKARFLGRFVALLLFVKTRASS